MMEWYISFSDDIILGGVALLQGFFRSQAESTVSRDALPASTDVPTDEVAMKVQVPLNQFPSWEKVLHLSQPVATTGQTSPTFGESKWRYCHQSSEARRARCQRVEEWLQAEQAERDSPSPESLGPIQIVAPPPGFKKVMACLQRGCHLQPSLRCPWSTCSQKQWANPW